MSNPIQRLETCEYLDQPSASPVSYPSEDQVIWQHMKVHYFITLLKNRKLYFSNATSYPSNVERDLFDAYWAILKTWKGVKKIDIKKISDYLMLRTFFSCWYMNLVPTNDVFLKFAGTEGLAISTTVKKIDKLVGEYNENTSENLIIACAPVQYVTTVQYQLKEDAAYVSKPVGLMLKTLVPLFYKFSNLSTENEFRMICRTEPTSALDPCTKRIIQPKGRSVEIGSNIDVAAFVDSVAILANQPDEYVDMLHCICTQNNFKLRLKKKIEQNADGFVLYDLEEG